MSTSEGNSNIGRPRPLIKRSKSMATTARKSSTSASSSRLDSAALGASQGSNVSLMQKISKVLNAPIVDSSGSGTSRERSPTSGRTSASSQLLRPKDKLGRNKDLPPIPRMRSASSLKSTTMSLLSDYSIVRSSVLSYEGSGRPTEEILEAAKRYYASMKMYLTLVDDLPASVRDTLEVQRLRQQLTFTVALLQPVMQEAHSAQTIMLLDNTLMLVKNILSDVQYLLLQQKYSSLPIHEAHDGDTSSMEGLCDSDITDMHLQILISEPDEAIEGVTSQCERLRRTKSSAALLPGPPSPVELHRPPNANSGLEPPKRDSGSTQSRSRKVRFTKHLGPTQETLVDISRSAEAVADSLAAIKEHPLFQEANRMQTSAEKPRNTIDITYGQDGIPIAMSATAIIKQLITELNSNQPNDRTQPDFSDIIFTTFRFFWDPVVFLQHLETAYDGSFYADQKISVMLLVRTWVLAYWLAQDSQTGGLIKHMRRFLGKALTDGLVSSSIVIDILTRLEEYESNPERSAIVHEVPEMQYEGMPFRLLDISRDMPLIRGNFESIRVMEFDSNAGCLELARQLTLKESALYLQLSAREVISSFVVKEKQSQETAAAKEKMNNMRQFGCAVKRWATWHILKRSTPLKRAKAFGFMMRLAKTLLGIRNFSSAHSVFNGALSIHLDILGQTEAEITPKARRNMELVTTFFEQNKDISMQSSTEPTVPIMASYAGKLSRLLGSKGVMTPSKVDQSILLVNIAFFKAATRVTYAMENNQHAYEFKAHAPLQRFIAYTLENIPDEDGIHERYVEVKADEQAEAKPGLIKRLRKSSMAALPIFS